MEPEELTQTPDEWALADFDRYVATLPVWTPEQRLAALNSNRMYELPVPTGNMLGDATMTHLAHP